MHTTRRSFLAGSLAAAAAGIPSPGLAQEAKGAVPIDARPTLAAPDDDPYLWLEEIDGARALDWVEARNHATLARFGHARFASDRDLLTAIFDRPDRIATVARRGGHLHNFWKDASNPCGLWRRTTPAGYRS